MPPDTRMSHYGVQDTAEEEARRGAAESARRWFYRAAQCERNGMMHQFCLDMADASLALLRGETK